MERCAKARASLSISDVCSVRSTVSIGTRRAMTNQSRETRTRARSPRDRALLWAECWREETTAYSKDNDGLQVVTKAPANTRERTAGVSWAHNIESGLKYPDVDVTLGKVENCGDNLTRGATKTVNTGHDEGVTRPHVRERSIKARTLPFAARRSVREEAPRVAAHVRGRRTGRLENHPDEPSRRGPT